MFNADDYWKGKEKPCPYAEGNRCFLVSEPGDESCKGCRWYEEREEEAEKYPEKEVKRKGVADFLVDDPSLMYQVGAEELGLQKVRDKK